MTPQFDVPNDHRQPFFVDGGPDSKKVLFIHGFTGSPQTFLPQYIAAANAGHTVSVPLLSGHGTVLEDMLGTRYEDYLRDVDQAAQGLGEENEAIYVVGISMGGTLSLDLALRNRRVKAMVLVNPLVLPPPPDFFDLIDQVLESGLEIFPAIGSDIANPEMEEASYPGAPVRAAKSLFEAAKELSPKVSEIAIPILLFNSTQDHVVAVESGEYLRDNAQNVTRVVLEKSFHVATLDYDSEIITEGMLEFITKN
ncbi:alpha/beta hydrolase [Acidithrix ferrooxidans]|uniref:Thermostable monoacylglycerol lipase n=1 Tax=Acidithrix ferrooxidans TaxID=1280514 RepID=A0A0D8HET2_9ACTN|nr:alpha/beta fold hydrolase [Acidithrix ferrooxidans]KJF16465.1 thermostable monoacylglycerol lipase [Acidithrix ferrooxidans]